MDALPFIKEMLSEPDLRNFLSNNVPVHVDSLNLVVNELTKVEIFMRTAKYKSLPEEKKLVLVKALRLTARKFGNFMREIVPRASRKQSISRGHDLVKDWKETLNFVIGIVVSCNSLKQTDVKGEMDHNVVDAIINSIGDIKRIENLVFDKAAPYKPTDEKNQALLLLKAFPALSELKESIKMLNFLLELSKELDNLPQLICKACQGQPLALLLIGSLLSLKQRNYDTWNKVKDDLVKIKNSNNPHPTDKYAQNITYSYDKYMHCILIYCYDDLPYFLKPCFLYLACYPIGYEIPARSLTELWIAEGFVTPDKGETIEDTANKYLEQLVQRSLICVSKRSFLDTIKYCRVSCSNIHELAIEQSYMDGFLVTNPDKEKMESMFRLAIHHDNKNQYTEVESNHMHSFLAFDFDRNVLGSAVFLRVLELRKSTIPKTTLPDMTYLRYLGLRGSKISELPKDIGDMKNLQTLDVRDTSIETLPESLWNILTLRHVYVKPSPQVKGPPSTANISDLQILKTVVVPESWLENFPQFLSNLRKLALSNRDSPDWKSNPYWKSISNMLGHMVNLISMAISGDIVPSEFVDVRAFPNLETVKSIKFEGKWICRKLFIDNVKFPPNLTKLTLTKSGLKEDPMPRLERLQSLRFLSLQDGAYTGKQMVCSENGFPQLQLLELKKLKNLEIWEVKPTAMSQLTTLRVVQCQKLNDLPNLVHVTIKEIYN